jgi:hypothetical protein
MICLGCCCFLHHIAFAPHALHIVILAHIYAYTLDHAEPELEEPLEQVQAKDLTNLAWIKASPGASHQ